MGRFTFRGLTTSLEGVPQTQFFLTGKNLPGPSKKDSDQKLDERSTPIPEEENPESTATGETP